MSKNPFANMGNLLKQAQEMQSKMGKIQEEAATKTVEASTGGGHGDRASQRGHANYQYHH